MEIAVKGLGPEGPSYRGVENRRVALRRRLCRGRGTFIIESLRRQGGAAGRVAR